MNTEIIQAYSLEQAFNILCTRKGLSNRKLIHNEEEKDIPEWILEQGFVGVSTSRNPGENKNKSQFSKVDHVVQKGTKKWLSKYMIVWDSEDSLDLSTKEQFDDKSSAVDKARELTEKTKRSTFVILGKSPDKFSRTSACIHYKPSQMQSLGVYEFTYK